MVAVWQRYGRAGVIMNAFEAALTLAVLNTSLIKYRVMNKDGTQNNL